MTGGTTLFPAAHDMASYRLIQVYRETTYWTPLVKFTEKFLGKLQNKVVRFTYNQIRQFVF